jgi:cold shock CspA family protein
MTTSSGAKDTRLQGIVRWYDPNRGYGFVALPDGDHFLHSRNLPADQRSIRPKPGTRIRFHIRTNHINGKSEAYDAQMEI